MKKIATILFFIFVSTVCFAQVSLDDFGRIVLNTHLPDNMPLSTEVKNHLQNKLNQIASNYGMGGNQVNPRFILTANVNIGTKDIIAGPPQMIAHDLELTLFIGDAITNTIFTNITLSLKGVGINENKSFIEAFKMINPKNNKIAEFLEDGKNKIIAYYSSQCDFILKQANTFAEQYEFEKAIFNLMLVPETCKDCFFKSQELAKIIFNKKIESDCNEKLKAARLIWSTEPNENGASKVSAILVEIVPSDNCASEITQLANEIKNKLQQDQKMKFDYDMQEMQKRYDNEQKRIDVNREIALEYAKNGLKLFTYSDINWR